MATCSGVMGLAGSSWQLFANTCWHHMHAVGWITCMNKFAHIHVHVIEMFLHARLIKLSCYHVVKLPTHSHFLNCDSLAIKFHCENVYNLTNSWVNLGLIF